VQGGYVSSSHGQQLNVTKKSNVLDKGKPNILNAATKKLQHSNNNHDQSNNNTTNNNATDSNDSGSHTTSKYEKQEREPSPIPPPAPAVPEVTVNITHFNDSEMNFINPFVSFICVHKNLASRYKVALR